MGPLVNTHKKTIMSNLCVCVCWGWGGGGKIKMESRFKMHSFKISEKLVLAQWLLYTDFNPIHLYLETFHPIFKDCFCFC